MKSCQLLISLILAISCKITKILPVLGTFFQQLSSEKLQTIWIEGSHHLTEETLQILSKRALPNLQDIWFPNCPNLKMQESNFENLKTSPKLKNLGVSWANLSEISTQFLREFNEQISISVHYQDNKWIDLPQKLKMEDYKQKVSQIFEGDSTIKIKCHFSESISEK